MTAIRFYRFGMHWTNLEGLRAIEEFLPDRYFAVFSDKAGNEERAGFLFDSNKVETLELFGEISVPPIRTTTSFGFQELAVTLPASIAHQS